MRPGPGSVSVRVGTVMDGIQLNVEQGDLTGFMNHVRLMRATCSPFLRQRPAWLKEATPDFHDGMEMDEIWEAGFQIVEACLCCLNELGLFGRHDQPWHDGSDVLAAAFVEEGEAVEI